MVKWRRAIGLCTCACLLPTMVSAAEQPLPPAPAPDAGQQHARPQKDRLIPDHFPTQPTTVPTASIPVDALGFSPPGPIYLGARNTLASLDFIGEDKVLFTFRVPGLLHREATGNAQGNERQIRAVVLSLPSGTVEAETNWTVHDRARYLWMLNDGRFLLRDRNSLQIGDASLALKPFLQFPGPLLWLELDPMQRYIVADSYEPAKDTPKPGDVPSPATASAAMTTDNDRGTGDNDDSDAAPSTVVRIMQRDTGKVMLVSRVRTTVHLPINSSGYLENLRGQRYQWLVNLSYFHGGSATLGSVDSNCNLTNRFISDGLVLITACTQDGGDRIVAMTTEGKQLWANQIPSVAIWPEVTVSPGGLRIGRETLGVSHAVNAYSPIDSDDIKGQWLTVYDAATGDMALETPVSPALDSGGNVAISPSGRRVAALNAGAIQIFDLPAPPPLPQTGIQTSVK